MPLSLWISCFHGIFGSSACVWYCSLAFDWNNIFNTISSLWISSSRNVTPLSSGIGCNQVVQTTMLFSINCYRLAWTARLIESLVVCRTVTRDGRKNPHHVVSRDANRVSGPCEVGLPVLVMVGASVYTRRTAHLCWLFLVCSGGEHLLHRVITNVFIHVQHWQWGYRVSKMWQCFDLYWHHVINHTLALMQVMHPPKIFTTWIHPMITISNGN